MNAIFNEAYSSSWFPYKHQASFVKEGLNFITDYLEFYIKALIILGLFSLSFSILDNWLFTSCKGFFYLYGLFFFSKIFFLYLFFLIFT